MPPKKTVHCADCNNGFIGAEKVCRVCGSPRPADDAPATSASPAASPAKERATSPGAKPAAKAAAKPAPAAAAPARAASPSHAAAAEKEGEAKKPDPAALAAASIAAVSDKGSAPAAASGERAVSPVKKSTEPSNDAQRLQISAMNAAKDARAKPKAASPLPGGGGSPLDKSKAEKKEEAKPAAATGAGAGTTAPSPSSSGVGGRYATKESDFGPCTFCGCVTFKAHPFSKRTCATCRHDHPLLKEGATSGAASHNRDHANDKSAAEETNYATSFIIKPFGNTEESAEGEGEGEVEEEKPKPKPAGAKPPPGAKPPGKPAAKKAEPKPVEKAETKAEPEPDLPPAPEDEPKTPTDSKPAEAKPVEAKPEAKKVQTPAQKLAAAKAATATTPAAATPATPTAAAAAATPTAAASPASKAGAGKSTFLAERMANVKIIQPGKVPKPQAPKPAPTEGEAAPAETAPPAEKKMMGVPMGGGQAEAIRGLAAAAAVKKNTGKELKPSAAQAAKPAVLPERSAAAAAAIPADKAKAGEGRVSFVVDTKTQEAIVAKKREEERTAKAAELKKQQDDLEAMIREAEAAEAKQNVEEDTKKSAEATEAEKLRVQLDQMAKEKEEMARQLAAVKAASAAPTKTEERMDSTSLKEGWLLLQAQNKMKKRFFVLGVNRLQYYEQRTAGSPVLGFIPLFSDSIVLPSSSKKTPHGFALTPADGHQTYILDAEDDKERQSWINGILEIIPTLPSYRTLRFEEEQAEKAAKEKEDTQKLVEASIREGWTQREEGMLSKTMYQKWTILHPDGKLCFHKTKKLADLQQIVHLYSDSMVKAEPARKNAAMLFSVLAFQGDKAHIVFVKDGQERDGWIDTINSLLPSLSSHRGSGKKAVATSAAATPATAAAAKVEDEPKPTEDEASPWGAGSEPAAASTASAVVETKEEPKPADDDMPPPPPEEEEGAAAAPANDGPRELTKAERDAQEREEMAARAEAQSKKDKEARLKREAEEKEKKDKAEAIKREKADKVKKEKEEKEAKERDAKEKKAKEEADKKAKADAEKAAAAEKAAHDKAEKEKVAHDKAEKEKHDKEEREKAERDKADKEKAEKAERAEKEKEAKEKSEREKAEREQEAASTAAPEGDPDLPPPPEEEGAPPAGESEEGAEGKAEDHSLISHESVYVRALFDLETEVETDLKFKTGDVIRLITPNVDLSKLGEECDDPVWLNGELMTNLQPGQNHIGSFPSNYVAVVKDHDD